MVTGHTNRISAAQHVLNEIKEKGCVRINTERSRQNRKHETIGYLMNIGKVAYKGQDELTGHLIYVLAGDKS